MLARAVPLVLLAACIGCGSDPIRKPPGSEGTGGTVGGPPPTNTISFDVTADRTTFVKLALPGTLELSGDGKDSGDWDLAFRGYEVYTNGGISGPGLGKAFGPLPASYFAVPDQRIETPFLIEDRAEGAFLRWYAYDGSTHQIYSRFLRYGVRSHGVLYKLQVLGYYGEVAGAPVSALYRLRYAVVTPSGSEETREVHDIDATAEGDDAAADAPSGCLVLASGEVLDLTEAEASQSREWDLCFRRDAIGVNGELGGPGAVTAVNLDRELDESVSEVKRRDAESELARFDELDAEALDDPALEYRGDYATSAFTGKWFDADTDPPAPVTSSGWLVVAADGVSRYLVGFNAFVGASESAPGAIELFVHPSP